MPIFEWEGTRYNVKEEDVEKFASKYPESTTIEEREGKKYRIKSKDYQAFKDRFDNGVKEVPHVDFSQGLPPIKSSLELPREDSQSHRNMFRGINRLPSLEAQLTKGIREGMYRQIEEQEKPISGFWEGVEQGGSQLKRGLQYFGGELANLVTGSSEDDKAILDNWDKVVDYYNIDKTPLEKRREIAKEQILRGKGLAIMDKDEQEKLYEQAKYLGELVESTGSIENAKKEIERRSKDMSWGDKQRESARQVMNNYRPTEGWGWFGETGVQIVPAVASIAASLYTKNPRLASWIGKGIGHAGMAGMSLSTAGSSMKEARDAGATNGEVWGVGLANAGIEYITEKIPFDRYTGKLFNRAGKKIGAELSQEVMANGPVRQELGILLSKANKKLGGKLFGKKNVKEYLSNIAAEGASEFTAEALQTITPMIYKNPEEYPTLSEIIANGWEGAKAGLFMGSVIGGTSKIAEHKQNKSRRKSQGYVDVAEFNKDGESVIGEVVGIDVDAGKFEILHDGKLSSVSKEDITDGHRFSYEEFVKGQIDKLQTEKEIIKEAEQTSNSPLVHRDSGMIEEAIMKTGDRKVYIIKGRVVPYSDGNGVDASESDESIIVYDAERGTQEQISPEALLSVSAPISPEEITSGSSEVAEIDSYISSLEEETSEAEENEAEEPISVVDRVPRDERGNLLYEQVDSDTAWDAIIEQTEGDEIMAQTVADSMVADKEAALKKLEKSKPKGGVSIEEKIASEKEHKAAIERARQELEAWKNIAFTATRRSNEIETKERRLAEEAAQRRKVEEERLRAEREEAERIERESLMGVPDILDDKPQAARARGFRRVSGHKIDRQAPIKGLQGKEISVKFSDDAIANGRVAVIEAQQLQPSHIDGHRNPLHFIDEAQPKERNDEASVMSARKIAGNIRPEEITSSVTAYTGAPTVNSRGEAIQGNNRSTALRQMWEEHQEEANKYKQYLIDHAEDFGFNADDVAAMERPVLVNMLDVEDTEAIKLGQYVAQDTESGGTERIKPKNAVQRMGSDMRKFANILLSTNEEDISFAGLIDKNGEDVLRWMSEQGYINPTQYKSAFDSRGNLTSETKNDLRGIMYQSIFQGGNSRLEEMFNLMPIKAQRAILATAFRDYDSPNSERMIEEIQNSIRAYYALSQSADFVNAKNYKEARVAVDGWKIQYQIDDVTGEGYLPADNFSNFALLLATMYKGENQSIIQGTFNKLYDLIQGTQEETLFDHPDNTPRTLVQAIYETLNITYDGQRRSNVLVGDSSASQRGHQGSTGDAATGERVENGEQTADSAGSIDGDSRGIRTEPEDRGNQEKKTDIPQTKEVIGRSLTADEAEDFIADMEENANTAPDVELTIENWDALFGEEGKVITPIGEVKMGENQFTKLMRQGRDGKLGMIKPTLEQPHAIVEDESEAKEDDVTERASSYVFIRSFKKADGSRYYYFTSVTVSKDGKEVVISNQEKRRKAIANLLINGKLVWKHADDVSTASDVADGLYSSQGNLSDPTTEGTVAPQTNISDSKDTTIYQNNNELGEKSAVPSVQEQIQAAEAEVNINPTEAQKEAGNYKKGHVQIGTFNVTIEQPKGSVRSGVDANGNEWETEMKNTYGYIRGTEGVDGDHIDVFLSDDIDGWNGRQVFVVDQYNEDGSFDEHKVMLGFNDIDEADTAYLNNYEKDWADKRKIVIRPANIEDFEKWIASSHRKTKPFAEYKSVQVAEKRANNNRLSEIKSRIEELHKEQETAHNRSDIFEEARIITEMNELFAEQRKLEQGTTSPTISQESEQVRDIQRLATEAVVHSLEASGIEVVQATDAMAEAVLGMGSVEMSAKKKRALETASVQEEHQPTVVSSADGAKVLNNLDNVATEYEEKSNQPKTFLGDVAKALGAERKGSGSQYVTFETKNGKVVTIRLSNHNAMVSNFDNNGESDGISIVVSAKGNIGITNDGDAHIVEHYYDAIKLRRAEGKPLAEIVRSIKQALYSGEFIDTTGLAERQEVNFNETDANIVGRVEFLRTPQGTIYGWTDGKKIYLTKDGMNPETPIHEYTHIWAKAMQQGNPDGWQSIKELLRGTPIWDEVINDPNYADIRNYEDAVASEALSRMSGRENARRMEQEARRMIDDAQGIFEKAEATTLVERMRKALREFWNWVGKSLFNIKSFGSIEEVTDRVLWDLIHNSQLNVESSQSFPIEKQIIGERGAASLDRSEEATHRMDNLAVARKMEAEFAEMDADVEVADNLSNTEEDDDTLYRSDDAIKNRIEALFNQAISGEFKGKPISIGRLTDAGKAYLEQISGVAFRENVDFVLNPSDLMHIYKDHFGNNEKDKGQNIPLDIEDIRSLADVISSPDKVIFFKEGEGSNRNMFYFFKEAEDGTYNLMEIYSDRKGNLTAKTFYKTRKDATQRVMDIEKSLLPTFETYSGAILSDAKIPQMFESASIEDDFSARDGVGAYTDDEVSFENDPISKVLGKPRGTRKQRREFAQRERQRMAERVERLAKKLNLDNVEVVTDASTLTSSNQLPLNQSSKLVGVRSIAELEGKKQRAKGFYTKSTGKITIVIPNHSSAFDVEQTLLHEAVAHYGLRQLFGEHFDTFLDNVFNNAEKSISQQIESIRKNLYRKYVENAIKGVTSVFEQAEIIANLSKTEKDFTHTATEEYLASLAETTDFENTSARWWRKIKDLFFEMLEKIGFGNFSGVTMSDNELRYILWRSYENLREPGRHRSIFGEAADVVKQWELGVGQYESATGQLRVAEVEASAPSAMTNIEAVNKRFNEQLENLTEANARETIFDLGMPSEVLTSCGIENKPIRLYGSKVIAKSKKHGYTPIDLRNLPKSLNNPIAVFSGSQMGSYAILTEIQIDGKNVLVSIIVGKGGHDVDFNIITSAYGKNSDNITRWINDGKLLYADKTRALDYLSVPAPIAGAQNNQELVLATKIVKEFENRNKEEGTVHIIDKLLSEYHQTFKGAHPTIIILKDKADLYEYAVSEGASESEAEEFSEQFIKEKSIGGYDPETNKIVIFAWNKGNYYATLFHEHVHYAIEQSGGIKHFETLVKELKELDPRLLHKVSQLYQEQEIDEEILTYSLETALYGEAFEDLSKVLSSEGQKLLEEILDKIGYEGRRNYGKEVASYEPDSNRVYLENKQSRTRRRIGERGGRMVRGGNQVGSEVEIPNGQSVRQTDETSGEDTGSEDNGLLSKIHQRRGEFKTKRGSAEKGDDVLYRAGEPEVRERVQARERYERRVKRGLFQSQEAIQDSMLSLKEAMESILGRKVYIEDVAGYENAYIGENRLSSVNKAECDGIAQLVFKPMLEEVAKLAHNEAERLELIDYMMAKHGLERNEDMREQAKQNGKTADRDFAGLTALTGTKDVFEAEVEAEHMVIDYEKTHDTSELWKKVKAVSKAILQKSYESGLISKETYDELSNRYEYYIPLRGFDEKTSNESYAYLSHKDSAFNAPIKKARGRSSKADDPFANLESMAESTIMQGNRNRLVKQRFFDFVMNHPSDLVSVSELWLSYNEAKDEWEPVVADTIREDDSAEEVERKTKEFESRMTQLSKQYPDRYQKGKDAIGIPYRVKDKGNLQEHQVIVKRGGVDYVLTVNGNPRLSQALNGLTNPDNDVSGAIGSFLRLGESLNRRLSAFYTTRNPDFVISNFLRDILYSNSMVWIKESPNYALRFHKNCLEFHPAKMRRLLSKYRRGELNMNDKTEAMFYRFMRNGGETGYVNIRDIERHKHDIKRELRKSQGRVPIEKAWALLGERFDELNRSVENCARFAAFVTSREMGRSIDRAIYDAKEISVNFNKKGSGAKFFRRPGQTTIGNASALVSGFGRSSYVFWNAGIQGSTNFGRQIKRHPAKALTGMATMYLLGSIIAYMGMDDEEDKNAYYNLPEYVRRSNIMFRRGDHWISIPLPIEFRAIYGMGELMMSVMSGKERMTAGELAESIAGQVSQVLPLDFMEGGGGWNAFVPSAAKPIIEAYITERSWTGLPLYKDNPWNEHAPEWTKAYSSANKYLVDLSMALNEASGGDEYRRGWFNFNPSKVEYLLNGYFGGVASTIDKMVKMGETWFGDREYDPRSFLLWNRIVKAGDERTAYRAVNREYYRLLEESEETKRVLRGYEQSTNKGVLEYAEKMDFLYNSAEYGRYEIYKEYQEYIDILEKMLDESSEAEEMKMLEVELNEVKKALINECEKVK